MYVDFHVASRIVIATGQAQDAGFSDWKVGSTVVDLNHPVQLQTLLREELPL